MLIVNKSFKQDSYTVILEVTETSKDLRLDQFLQLYLLSLSREFIKNKIKSKDVVIFNRPGNLRPAVPVLIFFVRALDKKLDAFAQRR